MFFHLAAQPTASEALRLSFSVVDEATNPEPSLNDALKGQSKGRGGAGLVASSTTSNLRSKAANLRRCMALAGSMKVKIFDSPVSAGSEAR